MTESNHDEKTNQLTPNRLDEIVNPAVLSEVLNGMVSAFNAECEKTEPFKELFKAGSSFTPDFKIPSDEWATCPRPALERRKEMQTCP